MAVDVAAVELDRLHERIAGRFWRSEPRARVREHVAGLEPKNGWTLAERAGEASPDGMQRLLRCADWDTREVRDDVRDYVTGTLGDPQGVLIADDIEFATKARLAQAMLARGHRGRASISNRAVRPCRVLTGIGDVPGRSSSGTRTPHTRQVGRLD
jgi:hypothetical protein